MAGITAAFTDLADRVRRGERRAIARALTLVENGGDDAQALLVVSVVLGLTLLRGAADEWRRAWVYALAGGLVVGELTWVLNYWAIGALGTAALLLLAFYILTGMAQQALQGRLTRRLTLEFLLFGGVLFIIILRLSQWLG